jgi:hypothetical protein
MAAAHPDAAVREYFGAKDGEATGDAIQRVMSQPSPVFAALIGHEAKPEEPVRDFEDDEPTGEIPVETMAEVVAVPVRAGKPKSAARGLGTDLAMGLHSFKRVREQLEDLRVLLTDLDYQRVIEPILGNLGHGVRCVEGVRGRL